jgi:hypothetical protein
MTRALYVVKEAIASGEPERVAEAEHRTLSGQLRPWAAQALAQQQGTARAAA